MAAQEALAVLLGALATGYAMSHLWWQHRLDEEEAQRAVALWRLVVWVGRYPRKGG